MTVEKRILTIGIESRQGACFGRMSRHRKESKSTTEESEKAHGNEGTARIKSSSFNHTEAKDKLRTIEMEAGEARQ